MSVVPLGPGRGSGVPSEMISELMHRSSAQDTRALISLPKSRDWTSLVGDDKSRLIVNQRPSAHPPGTLGDPSARAMVFPLLDTFKLQKRSDRSPRKSDIGPPSLRVDAASLRLAQQQHDLDPRPAYSSLRVPPTELRHQSSNNSLSRRDPFARLNHTFSGSISRQRTPIPWIASQSAIVSRSRSTSGSSFGTEFPVDQPPSRPPRSPARASFDPLHQHEEYTSPQRVDELSPADSVSNQSLPNLIASHTTVPPVPRLPDHLQAHSTHARTGAMTPSPTHLAAHQSAMGQPHDNLTRDRDYDEDDDHLSSLPDGSFGFGRNRSTTNVAGNQKADKMLGLECDAKLCSLFLISGVGPTDASKWVPADNDSSARVQPMPDSLGFYWRPETLGTAFSGPATEAFERAMAQGKKMKKDAWPLVMKPPTPGTKGPYVADAGPDGAEKLIARSMKYAHPRDVEVINTSLAPNTTAHYFSFSLPSHSATGAAARERLNSVQAADHPSVASFDQTSTVGAKQRQDLSKHAQITYYGATLTVWTSAEPDRARQLADIRSQLKRKGELDDVLRAPVTEPLEEGTSKRKAKVLPWSPYRDAPNTDFEASDTETVKSARSSATHRPAWFPFGTDPLHLRSDGQNSRRVKSMAESSDVGIGPLKAGEGDTFWMPYALTLVSRFPIYDTMIDYIRTSWSMYQKSARRNLYQMCKVLNHPVPRPGEVYRLTIGKKSDADAIAIESSFPGAVDFTRGTIKTDFALWPLFQAVDIDAILTAIEIALSNSGKVVFTSQYAAMLCLAVHTLRYMVEMRGWSGVTVPIIHSRDVSFIIEDPGPYIVGLPMECRYTLSLPADACVIDLDTNTLTLKRPPGGVITPRARREKVKQRIMQAFAKGYPMDKCVPTELKIAFPNNRFRPFHRMYYECDPKPHFLGERMRGPHWWREQEVFEVFDKIMQDKHKKPSLIQRLTKSGLNRAEAQLTVGEQLVKTMMRKRAMHYVEARDDIEQKVARINQRLMQLMQEGEKYRRQFQIFERQADLLADEALRLKNLIEREQKEAERLQKLSRQQLKDNEDLDSQLRATEEARATAMRQLSDMQESLHDLEREREAIMTIIEDQITQAIEGVQADTAEAPSSPVSHLSSLRSPSQHLGSPVTSKSISRLRPGTADTADTALSEMTRMTSKTEAISILGLARKGYGPANKRASVELNGHDTPIGGQGGDHKYDLAVRIAGIQTKLDLALSNVTRHKPGGLSAVQQENAGINSEVGDATFGTIEQKAALGLTTGELGVVTDDGTKSNSQESTRPPYSLQAIGAAKPSPAEADDVPRSAKPRTRIAVPLSRSNSSTKSISEIIRPGSRLLRIRKPRASDGGLSDNLDSPSHSHAKALTTSSSAETESELVTPSQSAILPIKRNGSDHDASGEKTSVQTDTSRRSSDSSFASLASGRKGGDEEVDRRLSSISTTTVTFGPI